jgi:hypothetical protein
MCVSKGGTERPLQDPLSVVIRAGKEWFPSPCSMPFKASLRASSWGRWVGHRDHQALALI